MLFQLPRSLARGMLAAELLLAGAAGQAPAPSAPSASPAPKQLAPAGGASTPAPAPAKVEQVRKARAEGLLGKPVTDEKGDVIGHVVDVLIDGDGTPHAAVIQFTGFFGIGDRSVAVAWKALNFSVQGDHIAISTKLDATAVKAMPEYTQAAASVPVATPAAAAPARPH